MAILKVARLGHPVLRQVAEPIDVDAIRSPETQRLVDDLVETMREVQRGRPRRHPGHTCSSRSASSR